MSRLLVAAALFLPLLGCAHLDRAQALAATRYDVMSDAEIARVAVREALGALHEVHQVDPETGAVTAGVPGFSSRAERLAFEARVDGLLRRTTYGQGPTLELVHLRCVKLQRTGWAGWPADAVHRLLACEYGDDVASVHELFRKPMLQRAYVEAMLEVVGDRAFAAQTREALDRVQRGAVEPYHFVVGRWERIEGFRPRS